MKILAVALMLGMGAAAACSSSNSGPGNGDAGNVTDGSPPDHRAGDTGPGADTGTPGDAGAEGGCTGGTITVHNFNSSCTVSLDGTPTSVSSSYEACVPLGNSAPIVVGPASTTFDLGPTPFVRISGLEVPDGGSSHTSSGDGGFGSTSTVIVGVSTAAGCVLVCCPATNGTGCDPSITGYSSFLADCPQ